MSRHRSDREDLMAEVVTLSPRICFTTPDFPDEIVAGRRQDGRWSIFLGGDPVYHFDAEGNLRRAFVQDRLYRTQGTTLARLTRQEAPDQTVLLRYDLNEEELSQFRDSIVVAFSQLILAISSHQTTVISAEPPNSDFRSELLELMKIVIDGRCCLAPALKRG